MALFLDIDGVLLPIPEMGMMGGDPEEECVRRLGSILARAPLRVVLTSTWRLRPAKLQALNAVFATHGLPAIAACTPERAAARTAVAYLADDPEEQMLVVDRVDEICEWLQANPQAVWLVLDDMDLSVDPRVADHFVRTDCSWGLQDSDVEKAMALLQAQGASEAAAPGAASLAAEAAAAVAALPAETEAPGPQVAAEVLRDVVERSLGLALAAGPPAAIVGAILAELLAAALPDASQPDTGDSGVPTAAAPDAMVPTDAEGGEAAGSAPPPGPATPKPAAMWLWAMERLAQQEAADRHSIALQEDRAWVALWQPLRQAVNRHRHLAELERSLPGHLAGPTQARCTKGLREALKQQHVQRLVQHRQAAAARRSLALQATLRHVAEDVRTTAAVRQLLRDASPAGRRRGPAAAPA